ncbi:hypothetical protein Ccrd_009521 [Cynara cardunculus var. scolymus]|uniref:Uncharacterized protein n=1 Tax=Cynara cardunculus var. scolymus TaxID=59895 RepID=A0A118K7D4_CYNCS|nr:hypothetical protein Ccrd_009521 [Cynara cardunculus var. scolymus]
MNSFKLGFLCFLLLFLGFNFPATASRYIKKGKFQVLKLEWDFTSKVIMRKIKLRNFTCNVIVREIDDAHYRLRVASPLASQIPFGKDPKRLFCETSKETNFVRELPILEGKTPVRLFSERSTTVKPFKSTMELGISP